MDTVLIVGVTNTASYLQIPGKFDRNLARFRYNRVASLLTNWDTRLVSGMSKVDQIEIGKYPLYFSLQVINNGQACNQIPLQAYFF